MPFAWRSALLFAALYAAAGAAWLLASDALARWALGFWPEAQGALQYRDWLFFAVSAPVLAWFLYRALGAVPHHLSEDVLEHSMVACLVTDARNRVLRVNRAFTRLTGYGAAEVVGRDARMMHSGIHDPAFYEQIGGTLASEGSWQGEIWDRHKNGEVYPAWLHVSVVKDASGAITHYISNFTDLTRPRDSDRRRSFLECYDPLTLLPNRYLFRARLTDALARHQPDSAGTALFLMDLDRFKTINESLGHGVGDVLLKSAADRLREVMEEGCTLAHLGGDEFTVIAPNLGQVTEAGALAERIMEALAQPFRLGEAEVFVSASIGISLYPRDGADETTLLKNADTAMYRAKHAGRNCYRYYASEMNARAGDALAMESELRRSLERGEFVVYFQPRVSLPEKRVVAMEGLLRWQRPGRGLVLPDEFIPVLEDNGLIVPTGEWVLRAACRQAREWADAGLPRCRVAVNISALQLRRDLAQKVRAILEETGLDPDLLELEMTESVIMQGGQAVHTLSDIKGMGVHVSIDDFGTGYSSLSYLKRFPIDILKIDRSFIRDLPADGDAAAIARAVIALGRSLKLTVVGEGVETAEQARFLVEKGCHEAQGFAFGRPMTPGEAGELLRAQAAGRLPGALSELPQQRPAMRVAAAGSAADRV